MPVVVANSLWWWILVVWLTVLGGCVGSFLNVVIYRLPRGENLSYPGSRCPQCGHSIRWYHNVPVIGWILLRGRCYDCRAPISPRYPIIEGIVAGVFLVLAVTGPLAIGAWDGETPGDPALAPLRALWAAFAWEAALVCALLALILIDRDIWASGRGRFPLRLVGAAFATGVVLPILVPGVLVHTYGGAGAPFETPSLREVVRHVGFGAVAGCGCGCVLFAASRGEKTSLRQSALPALVGPYVGPWVVLQLVTISLLVCAVPRLLIGRTTKRTVLAWRWPYLFWLATLGGILAAHQRAGFAALPTHPSLAARVAIGCGLLAAVFAFSIAVRMRREARRE